MQNEAVTSYLSLGSNLGDRAGNLLMAVRGLLEASVEVCKLSGIYETDAVDMGEAPPFLNLVAEVRTVNVTPTQMMARLLRIEYLLGRTEKSMKRPRTIDLDIIFFGERVMDTPFLTLPHPRMHLRRFVLAPLAEIAPHVIHPVLHRPIADLLAETSDMSSVTRWNPAGAVQKTSGIG
ncbi:MAG: 2-amino-4-hydroxy-6-hydroxymethyldihydropteridine diphosphokinase [Acidobacteria bacterium]|nr:2-amino-4-hydroxy-6-hydroxymethyldihydropteridine diphosphokinase [Acidobacteriota bacterium]